MTIQNKEKKPYSRKIEVVFEDKPKKLSPEAERLKEGIKLVIATGRAVHEDGKGGWGVVTDEELTERKRCSDNNLCQRCKKPLKGEHWGEDYHTPYWIPLCHGYFWCTECWDKGYHKGHHTWCPHNKDPHKFDEYNELVRKSNEALAYRDGVNIPVHIVKKVSE